MAGEAGAEGDHTLAPGRIDVLEHALSGKRLGEHLAQTTAPGIHLHIGGHPDHGALFGDHLLAALQLTDHDGERTTFDLITHIQYLL